MIFFLALRNLVRNIKSSLLLILLIALVSFVFFLGSSLIGQSSRGMEKTYVQNLTGDLVIQKESRVSMNLFGANTPVIDDFFTIPVLPAYNEVRAIADAYSSVAVAAAVVSGNAVMDAGGLRKAVPLLGVEAESYFDLFPGIVLDAGRVLTAGEEGIMLTSSQVKSIEAKQGSPFAIGSPVKLTSAGQNSFSIREVPLVGVFHYTNPGPYMQELSLADAQTVRALSSVLSVATQEVEVDDEALELLDSSMDMDALFGGEYFFAEVTDESSGEDFIAGLQEELQANDESGDKDLTGGDWNFIILRLKEGASAFGVQNNLNGALNEYGVRTVGWQTAAGNSALMVLLIQALFYGGMVLVGFAAVVTIVNIILISVFKRTKEIGTLRAIGASDGYIISLLLSENFVLSLLGGAVGVASGNLFAGYINTQFWPVNQSLIAALLGSPVLFIEASAAAVVQSVLLALFLGVAASLFPAWKAVLINPMEAVRRC